MIFWMLVAATVLAPLPFGAIYPWSYTLLAVLVGGLVTLWSATIALSGRAPAARRRRDVSALKVAPAIL